MRDVVKEPSRALKMDIMKYFRGHYILEGKKPVPEPDILKWAAWFDKADRNVAKTQVKGYEISTVFLGTDYSFGGPKPIVFETMVFPYPREIFKDILHGNVSRHPWEDIQEHYSTWEEAEKGHRRIVAKVIGIKAQK